MARRSDGRGPGKRNRPYATEPAIQHRWAAARTSWDPFDHFVRGGSFRAVNWDFINGLTRGVFSMQYPERVVEHGFRPALS